ncbi:MAG: radical SAM protein [Clostridia bacterium]|nr:radical SAM protein [Clostridia bacterium]
MKRDPKKEEEYLDQLNRNIITMLKTSLRYFLKNPALTMFILKSIFLQKKAVALRGKWRKQGVEVPPFMILSITHRCNLHCKGCYARAQQAAEDVTGHGAQCMTQHVRNTEMDDETLKRVVKEAAELGISIILVAGGEPLLRPEILDIATAYPQIIFALFTNGLLLDEQVVKRLKKSRNILPIISLEGGRRETDGRRGEGLYDLLRAKISRLGTAGILSGASFTLTSANYALVTQGSFINDLIKAGTKVFFYVEYVPVSAGTEELVVSKEQRAGLKETLRVFRHKLPAVFISFPGDEEELGGCLAAGRGFVHINPGGSLEPCPFAPYSDSSLAESSLREALNSRLLRKIRENREILEEAGGTGGCTLWAKRDLVQALVNEDR